MHTMDRFVELMMDSALNYCRLAYITAFDKNGERYAQTSCQKFQPILPAVRWDLLTLVNCQFLQSTFCRCMHVNVILINCYVYSDKSIKSWKIKDLSACNISFPCFKDCINKNIGYEPVDQCDQNQYEVYCRELYTL